MPTSGVSQAQLSDSTESLRSEFQAGLTTVGVQIGAVEKTLKERLSSLKAWGIASLLGGQTLAALVSKYAEPSPASAVHHAARVVARIFA